MKRARVVLVNDFKRHGDLKMYSQLPDYDGFQCYDLGVGGILSQVAHKIYANFHKPSCQTLKHHLFTAEIHKKLPKALNDVSENDKRPIPNRK